MFYRFLFLLVVSITFAFASENDDIQQAATDEQTSDRLASFLTDKQNIYVKTNQPFTVCSVAQAAGSNASIDIANLITSYSGLNLIASPALSWQEGLDGLQNKTCDILPWATETVERSITMNFTRPYARIIRVIVTRQGQPYIDDISAYSDKLFVTEKDNNIVKQLKESYPFLQTIRAEHTSGALDLVADDKAFASIASLYSVGNLFNSRNNTLLKIAGRLPASFDDVVSFATRKEDRILHEILEKSVLTANPTLIRDFMSEGAIFNYQPAIDYFKVWLVSGAVVSLILLLFWWNRYLSKMNNRLEITHAELGKAHDELELLSITDPLTGTYNRLKIDRIFSEEIKRSERYEHPLSIFMIDIDYFKNVNDNYGHLIGDQVLSDFSLILQKHLRANDFLGRWGGEEFLVLCPATKMSEAVLVAEKLRKAVEQFDFSPVKKLTASFGITQWQKGYTQEVLISKADYALYLSKHQGRNKVSTSEV